MHSTRHGQGKPLLLVHGLGNTKRSWQPVLPALAAEREVIAVDLPGHGATPAEHDSATFAGLARSLDAFLTDEGLDGIDVVGASLGGRLVLELARRGRVGHVVSLDPGGFWQGWERDYVRTSLTASVGLTRLLGSALPGVARNPATRTALLAQLSARPWALDGDLIAAELSAMAGTETIVPLIHDLAEGPMQQGPAAPSTERVTIGWGKQDRLLFPLQAERAVTAFPGAELHWFANCGHFPAWDQPAETVELILRVTG